MLIYGKNPVDYIDKTVVYNFSGLKEGYYNLSKLIPPNSLGRSTERDFDIAYMNYILASDEVFCEFFQIIYNLYIGNDVFIIKNDEDWSENIFESLIKLIQQRYGYNAIRVENDEDYIYSKNNCFTDFAPGYGLYNLDCDRERFISLVEKYRQFTGGKMPFYVEGYFVNE